MPINETLLTQIKENNPDLKNLNLASENLTAEDFDNLIEALKSNNNIHKINLSGNLMSTEKVKGLMEVLTNNKSLSELSLDDTQIGPDGAEAIAEFLANNQSLRKLSLDDNQIGGEGALYLARAISLNKGLVKLSLEHNGIGYNGASAFHDALKVNSTLENLNLLSNSDSVNYDIFQGLKGIRSDNYNIMKFSPSPYSLQYRGDPVLEDISGWEGRNKGKLKKIAAEGVSSYKKAISNTITEVLYTDTLIPKEIINITKSYLFATEQNLVPSVNVFKSYPLVQGNINYLNKQMSKKADKLNIEYSVELIRNWIQNTLEDSLLYLSAICKSTNHILGNKEIGIQGLIFKFLGKDWFINIKDRESYYNHEKLKAEKLQAQTLELGLDGFYTVPSSDTSIEVSTAGELAVELA